MNIVFIQGKIITDIQFEFIINNKNISIAIFKIQLLNKSIVTVKAYNKLSDFCYNKLQKNNNVFIEGEVNSKLEIITKYIKN